MGKLKGPVLFDWVEEKSHHGIILLHIHDCRNKGNL